MNNLYVVSYAGGSIGNFLFSEEILDDTYVIVSTSKGESFGKIIQKNNIGYQENKYDSILRIATNSDVGKARKNMTDEKIVLSYSRKLAKELNLKMSIISANYSFTKSQLLINFYADDRIDFREYAKKIAQKYKTRIELRQVGARDRSKEVCGIGQCGQKLCCSRFLKDLDSVSINMAKNQCLALNPSKINGCCNRLMCCLAFEDEVYKDNRKKLPLVGSTVDYKGNKETVRSLKVLENKAIIYVDRERIEISGKEDC